MNKLILLALMGISMLSVSAYAHGLEEYPELYVSDGKVNAIVVVDDEAPASYVIVQTGIVLSLNEKAGAQQQGVAKLVSEVPSLSRNIISIGNPCENKISGTILKSGDNCLQGFKPGMAKIELVYDESTKLTHIVAAGYTQKGTLEAAKRLKDAANEPLGEFTIIEFDVDDPLESEEEKTEEVPEHDITQEEQTQGKEVEPQPPVEEHPQGQQEAPQAEQENEKAEEGIFQRFIAWLASLFG